MQRRQIIQWGAASLAAPAIAQEAPTITWRVTSSFPKALDTIFGAAETMTSVGAGASTGVILRRTVLANTV